MIVFECFWQVQYLLTHQSKMLDAVETATKQHPWFCLNHPNLAGPSLNWFLAFHNDIETSSEGCSLKHQHELSIQPPQEKNEAWFNNIKIIRIEIALCDDFGALWHFLETQLYWVTCCFRSEQPSSRHAMSQMALMRGISKSTTPRYFGCGPRGSVRSRQNDFYQRAQHP